MFDPQQSYTLDEYWKLAETFPDRKYEYIDGVIRMMTGGSPVHGQIAVNISYLLVAVLRDSECNVYNSDVALQLLDTKCYYPDVSVSCDPRDWTRKKALEAPTVVLEVLSPTTERIDKVEKLQVYQYYPPIQEILFVDSRKCYVEHYHRISSSRWTVSLYTDQHDVIDLESIEARFTLHDIYSKVYLELEEEPPS
ncbi:Uma2 family endonuclease [Dictyobacter aurantiacus]|uniref:Putative restriction endonuclease domain-containing protein n=1 Tax=Dictyobacter aurantiacus TaxID=1936993 RepID=A0A401ZDW4_9CHLR|nr:Uma2 family endonuclease [Dictyobacter aurantiacus]GCE05074.1 hypothetical protein KDAU_24030 [Dictyobacter aurantiacus]